ncbi:hypothetical protein LTR84_008422 [Exophiala bonariae]|uniref:Transcription factor domain-containing protein n=1 Tax=Exophiala bonariae TaxID=1690606 RepID=A0AAV9MXD9_9EURO|nr:hypothetical protein LTR84_008422 [Exophiala bonariae]
MKLLFVPDKVSNPVRRQVINRHIIEYVKARDKDRLKVKAKMLSGGVWRGMLTTLQLEPWASITQLSDPLAREVFHYSVNIFWPGFDPGAEKHAVAKAWAPIALQEPVLFNALMWAAILHIQTRRRTRTLDLAMLSYYHQTVELLRTELSKQAFCPRDGLIMAVLFLQIDDSLSTMKWDHRHNILGTFSSLQWLDDYSRLPFVESHRVALVNIIGACGIDCLEVRGLASLVQYFDVISSTLNLTNPTLPLCKLYRTVQDAETRFTAFGHHIEEVVLKASEVQPSLSNLVEGVELDPQIVELILDLRTLCLLFEVYQSGRSDDCNLSKLSIHRNLIHYRLLESMKEMPVCFGTSITGLVRSTLLAFNMCVIFRVVHQYSLRSVLEDMKSGIDNLLSRLEDKEMIELCTWCCMIGAIGSIATGNDNLQFWFENQLLVMELSKAGGSELDAPVRTYSDVRMTLERYLWYGRSCDAQAILVWQRVHAKLLHILSEWILDAHLGTPLSFPDHSAVMEHT